MDKYFTIGKIVNTQGLKGDLRAVSDTDDINRFELLDYVLLENPDDKSLTKYQIENVWYHKSFVVFKFKGIDNMTDAEKLKAFDIKIPEELGLKLEEDEYYIRDLYDMEVYEENNNILGVLTDILNTGSNDVYVVTNKEKGQLLLPAINECIKQIDVENKKMIVHVMNGLEWQ
ncbi:MAG TPA: 16S rRNA processing protein RimM [Clostridiales bacterium]|nr:MAG: 16S rRNA processing protein RimM [Clostridiales bacterium GWD2_32_19]HCC07546.1 16S rRNA processing protein RimM [Clostridiales bacterium]